MHFLLKHINPNWPTILWRQHAAVRILIKGKNLEIQQGLTLAKGDVTWVRLPTGFKVVNQGGKEILPNKGNVFLVSSETFDPCHLLTEVPSST